MTIGAGKSSVIWVAVAASVVLIVILAGVGFFWWLGSGLCGNELSFERPSPSGANKALVFVRNCGATTPYYTHISVLKGNEKLNDSMTGNCGGFRGESSAVDFEWKSDSELLIELAKEPIKRSAYCGGVHVTYRVGL